MDNIANGTCTLPERILAGIRAGMDRQWFYAKDLSTIKPEYLLTISVADELIKGFDDISGLDITVRLEPRTAAVHRNLIVDAVNWKDYFKSDLSRISRKGFVDIYVKTEHKSFLVELKNIDPSSKEIRKEVSRLGEFLLVNKGCNHCSECHIGFPRSFSNVASLRRIVDKSVDQRLDYVVLEGEQVVTNEDPEDGLPAFYPICISMFRR